MKILRMVHPSYMVVAFALGVILGAVCGLIFRIRFFNSGLWVAFVVLVLLDTIFRPKLVFVVLAFSAGMVLMLVRFSYENIGEALIRDLYGRSIEIKGVIAGDPETDEKGTQFKISNLKIGGNELAGSLFVTGYKNSSLERGDEVVLAGKLTEGFGVHIGYLYHPEVMLHFKPEPGNFILGVRNWFAERIKRVVGWENVNLGLSYLLGMKTGLSDELSENLRIVGLTHIVVASGAHLSILVEVARKIFGRLSRFAGLLFSVVFILFFMAMIGWTPSILRAGIMSILGLVTWYVGRKMAPLRMILIVAAITLLVDPMFIMNLGWQLSFASYAGIMVLAPRLTRYFYGEKKPGFIGSTIITTLAATMMTLPITLYYYGTMSLISVVANLLILPTLPYAMGLMFLSGVVCDAPFLQGIVGFLSQKILGFHVGIINFLGEMKYFLVQIPTEKPQVFLIYLVIFTPITIGLFREKMIKLKKSN